MRLFRKQIDVIGFGLLLAVLLLAALKMSALNVREATAGDSTMPPPNLFLPAIFGDEGPGAEPQPTASPVPDAISERRTDWRQSDTLSSAGWLDLHQLDPGYGEPDERVRAGAPPTINSGRTAPHS